MSEYGIRVVVEKIDLNNNNKTVEREEISTIEVKPVDTIMDLGLRHGEQIELLEKLQNQVLKAQSDYLKCSAKKCDSCNSSLRSNGYSVSKFHAVFTDHDIKVQKLKCGTCKKSIISSVKSLLGTSVHPDLYRLQCEQGANHTYRKAQNNLNQMCNKKRTVNNHTRVQSITKQVGELLSEKNKQCEQTSTITPANNIIVQVDGGHIKTTEAKKRSIEVMSAKVYRPESVVEITETKAEIQQKTCVASAKSDKQSSMKKYLYTAAKYQGLSPKTTVIGLADGAKNCWGIIKSLKDQCRKLTCILDWFHIAKKFEPVIKSAPQSIGQSLSTIKSHLWKGEVKEALILLEEAKVTAEEGYKSKINGIYSYIKRNQDYIVDYNSRAKNQQVYTSQVAESTVEHLINDRHKRNQKMQWSRDGAHHVLQIRSLMASNRWEAEWQDAVFDAIKAAA